jgi:hypothetical protein
MRPQQAGVEDALPVFFQYLTHRIDLKIAFGNDSF